MHVTEDEDSIIVTCQFASGTDAEGFLVDIQTEHNRTVLSRNVSLIQCVRSSLPCLLDTSFYKSELLKFGNFTISVYNWDKDGRISKVFSYKHLKASTGTATTTGSTDSKTDINSQIVTGNII